MPARETERVSDDRSGVFQGLPLKGSPIHRWDTEIPKPNEENEKENAHETSRRGIEELYLG